MKIVNMKNRIINNYYHRILLIFILFCYSIICSSDINAQYSKRFFFSEKSDVYFRNNIASLDPIEGFYDMTFTMQGKNAFQSFPPDTQHQILVVRKHESGKFMVCYDDDSFTESYWIERVGSTNVYNFYHYYGKSGITNTVRFVLDNNSHFEVVESVPDQQIRYDQGHNYQAGMAVVLNHSYIKTYPTPEMYYNAVPSTQQVEEITDWTGTGFALNNGYIATNYHVVENAKSISVQGIRGSFVEHYKADVIATDKVNDIAIIKINDSRFNGFGTLPYRIKTSISDVGEDVFVLGYPLTTTMGDEIKLTTGVISSKTGFQGDVSLYQISAPIQPGNSGGPLFDGKGNLIGIVSAKHRGAENVGYAIKTSYLNNLVESTTGISLPANNTISTLSLSEKVKKVKNFIFLITCSGNGDNKNNSNYSKNTSSSARIINDPSVRKTTATRARINKVTLTSDYTAVEITTNNQKSASSGYEWCNINKYSYIIVDNKTYSMIRAEGIAIDPDKTYFNYLGQDLTFTLYFQPIPLNATSMDLIETQQSEWKWYGINLR